MAINVTFAMSPCSSMKACGTPSKVLHHFLRRLAAQVDWDGHKGKENRDTLDAG